MVVVVGAGVDLVCWLDKTRVARGGTVKVMVITGDYHYYYELIMWSGPATAGGRAGVPAARCVGQPHALNPKPQSLNSKPCNLNPAASCVGQPCALNSQPQSLNSKP